MQNSLTSLLEDIRALPSLEETVQQLETCDQLEIHGVVGSLRSLILVHIMQMIQRPILWIFESQDHALQFKADVECLAGLKSCAFFPQPRKSKWGHDDVNVLAQQAETLSALSNREIKIFFAPHTAIWTRLTPPQVHARKAIRIACDEACNFDQFIKTLQTIGYEREPVVEKPGDMAVRGGIVDLFQFTAKHPVRIEFWGNRIESIREFDVTTQRSIRPIPSVTILPRPDAKEPVESATLIDYLPEGTVVVFNDAPALQRLYSGEQNNTIYDLGVFEPGVEEAESELWQEFLAKFKPFRRMYITPLRGQYAPDSVDFRAKHLPPQNGDIRRLIHDFRQNIREWKGKNYFLCESPGHAQRMLEVFLDRGLVEQEVTITSLSLNEGFLLPADGLFVYTDHQFYGRIRRQKIRRKYYQGLTLRQLKTLTVGDFIVHEDYGVGVFRGLEKIRVKKHERECLVLEYQDGDKLYVPLDRMDRVQKYTGRDGVVPTIHKLGTQTWERLKQRAKARAKDIARELIQLYALRKAEKGFAFSPDTTWQKELEASFMYEDTPDQLKATIEVKRDMEREQPMDRLICGDVGYGKTEVAVRAAFKAVQDGKQVAVLVPTTILAEQHYNTFRERLSRFPVRVEVLSRFRTPKQQKEVIEGLKQGQVDIVIGTHRLLSKDVEFKDLGLLIIDEEQRFGVRHKERLKHLRINVDVLTLSATPIPRTLQMSLLGVRDMSQIHTPPRDRLPIQTEIIHFDKKRIREAILREVQRGGQVFFVHNRVESIYLVAQRLADLVPEVDIAVAHGQMKERDLEKVMWDFMHRHYQVLVTTMIIESGLDMPNVNTIFINRADRFGLAQLYQLRGRVGRSNQKAYCYLIVPPIQKLTPEAIRRLETIEEYTDLGSGMQIALRDLEIRGAGNLLGAEQSGYMDAMGYETYMKILEQAVKELKKEELPEEEQKSFLPDECKVDADVDAYLPQNYVESASDRVDIYRRVAYAGELNELEGLVEEVRDRFGRLPEEAANLFNLTRLKLLGRQAGFARLILSDGLMVGYFAEKLYNDHQRFKEWVGKMLGRDGSTPVEFIHHKHVGLRVALAKKQDFLEQAVQILRQWLQNESTPAEKAEVEQSEV